MKYVSRRFTDDNDDTAVMHFLVFFTLHMTWECAFFGYVRLLPSHLQVL